MKALANTILLIFLFLSILGFHSSFNEPMNVILLATSMCFIVGIVLLLAVVNGVKK